jgi:hypothetical protein
MLQFQRKGAATAAILISSSLLVLVQTGINGLPSSRQKISLKDKLIVVYFVCLFVSMGVRGKPRMYYSLAGFLYCPLWTFQLWPPDACAPTDASRNLAAEVGTYGRGIRTSNLA